MTPFSQWMLVIGLALVVGGFWLAVVLLVRWRSRRRAVQPPARRPRSQRPAAGTVAFRAGRVQQPRVPIGHGVACSTRGPVASPLGHDGDATAVFPSVPAGALSPASRHRAGRDLAPLGSGRPASSRLERATANAPRRAGVPGRVDERRGTRPGTPSEQTAVLHRVQDAPTETWPLECRIHEASPPGQRYGSTQGAVAGRGARTTEAEQRPAALTARR